MYSFLYEYFKSSEIYISLFLYEMLQALDEIAEIQFLWWYINLS